MLRSFLGVFGVRLAADAHPKSKAADQPTFGNLIDEYLASTAFQQCAPQTQKKHLCLYPVLKAHFGHLLPGEITNRKVESFLVGFSGKPGNANNLLSRLRARCREAIRRGQASSDPTAGIKAFKLGTFHTWTDAEIAQFESHWPRGSLEPFTYQGPMWNSLHLTIPAGTVRLAFDLFLLTDQRRSDVARMAWSDILGGRLYVRQQKTGRELSLPLHPALVDALAHFPRGNATILVNGHGNPFSPDDLSNMMRAAIKAAGLAPRCKPHGIRKATLRRLAERGATAHQLQAVSGHTDLRSLAVYTAAVDQTRLSDSAMALLDKPDIDA